MASHNDGPLKKKIDFIKRSISLKKPIRKGVLIPKAPFEFVKYEENCKGRYELMDQANKSSELHKDMVVFVTRKMKSNLHFL